MKVSTPPAETPASPFLTSAEPEDLPPARLLPEGYYVDNFLVVLKTVVERYQDILHAEELAFVMTFRQLSLAAKRLYVRLSSRKGPFFRRDLLSYREIPDLDSTLAELMQTAFADACEGVATTDLLPLLRCFELRQLAAELTPGVATATMRKELLLSTLREGVEEEVLRSRLTARYRFIQPLHQELILIFRLLFFGNLSQDWTAFVLHDLGVVRYEAYELRHELRLFPTRRALDDALQLRFLREQIHVHLTADEHEVARELGQTVLQGIEQWHPSSHRLADRILNRLGRALERAGEDDNALAFYTAAKRPPARERRARILARTSQGEKALALCEEIASSPHDETERVFAPFFADKLRRRMGIETPRRRARQARPVVERELARREGEPVELTALGALAATGRDGFFAENWLWKSLFGLAFWDIIFAPIEGAFQHPFQLGPLDLFSPDFRQARRVAIEERLAELTEDPAPSHRLLAVYEHKRNTANAFVAWQEDLRPRLELALAQLSGRHLAWVCERLSRNPGRFRRGFPDLFVLAEEKPGFELLEVKGPGDQLRPEQQAWIDYLNAGGLPTKIFKIRWAPS